MTSVNLQFFWDLAKPEAELRQEAASTLIQYLQEVQTKQSDAEELSDDLEYTLKRLVKGLCSSRAAARQGFALALTEILVTFKDLISTAKFQELEQEYVSLAAHTNRKEKREFYFGRIFVAVIYCRSGRLADLSVESEVLTMVQQLEEFSKKVHLREIAFDSIRLIIDSLDFQVFFEHLYPYLMSKFFQGADVSTCSPEEISLGLAIKHKHSQYKKKRSQNKKAFPKLQISDTLKHLLSTKNFSLLSTTLAAASHTHPRVHSVWNHVFDILLSNLSDDGDSDDAKTPKWALFWKAVVDGTCNGEREKQRVLVIAM